MTSFTSLIYPLLRKIYSRTTPFLPKSLSICIESFLELCTRYTATKAWDKDFKKKDWSNDKTFARAYESWYRKTPLFKDYHSTPWENDILTLLSRFVPAGGLVLDAGCGPGDLTLKIVDAGYRVISLDISQFMLETLRRRIKTSQKITLIKGYLEHMDAIPDKSIDAVVCTHALEHVRDLKRTLSEINRVAKRLVIIVVPLQDRKESTPDYHLQFFPDVEQFLRKTELNRKKCHIHYKKLLYKGEILAYYEV